MNSISVAIRAEEELLLLGFRAENNNNKLLIQHISDTLSAATLPGKAPTAARAL